MALRLNKSRDWEKSLIKLRSYDWWDAKMAGATDFEPRATK